MNGCSSRASYNSTSSASSTSSSSSASLNPSSFVDNNPIFDDLNASFKRFYKSIIDNREHYESGKQYVDAIKTYFSRGFESL